MEREYSFVLRSGKRVLLSEEDQDLQWYSWHQHTTGPIEHIYYEGGAKIGKQKHVVLRRVIAARMIGRKLSFEEKVSHKNGNLFDCRRENLQIGKGPYFYQRKKSQRSLTPYKGVRSSQGKWLAFFIEDEGTITKLGLYSTPEEAAFIFNQEMKKRGISESYCNLLDEEAQRRFECALQKREQKDEGITEFPLKTGELVFLSEEDRDLSLYSWHLHSNMGVARRDQTREKRPYVFLKRIIMERVYGRSLERGEAVLHKDGNAFNLRRENLYVLNREKWRSLHRREEKLLQTKRERGKPHLGTSLEDCVAFDERLSLWVAVVPNGKEYLYIGTFEKKEDAVQACRGKI